MALFREHVSFGALVGALGITLIYFYALITDPLLLAILFGVTVVGSFLPDLDSDSGIPFAMVFGAFTLACGSIVLYYFLQNPPANNYILFGAPLAAMLAVWFILGTLLKRFTQHRGMMHSVPVMLIVGLFVYLIARYLAQSDIVSLLFAAAAAAGFLSHLVLDEIHSELNLEGILFIPKRSLGTALKLFSNNTWINTFTYLLLITLLYTAFNLP